MVIKITMFSFLPHLVYKCLWHFCRSPGGRTAIR